mgnify:CR=1 FL=1
MKRIEKMAELFAHLITRNDARPFNEVWDIYFKVYHEQFGIGNMNIEEIENWLLEEIGESE